MACNVTVIMSLEWLEIVGGNEGCCGWVLWIKNKKDGDGSLASTHDNSDAN